jgi:hypothetical protein
MRTRLRQAVWISWIQNESRNRATCGVKTSEDKACVSRVKNGPDEWVMWYNTTSDIIVTCFGQNENIDTEMRGQLNDV